MLLVPATASAAPELSTSDRLQDRREVTAGTRAYSVGFQDGRFYANGWHITGEMGGVWAPPLKLADGLWFGVDDQWAGQATKFTSGRGYTRYDLPPAAGLELRRIDFVPDGRRAALYGLELGNPGPAAKTVTVKVDVRSELLGAYPWGFDNVVPNAKDNLADKAAFENGALVFTDAGTLPGGEPHDYAMLAASDRRPSGGETGPGHWGPQPGKRCAASDQVAPSACDDGPFGNGAGGQLQYRVTVRPHSRETVWIALAGSDQGLQAARRELSGALRDPGRQLAEKAAARAELSEHSALDLPGDRQLQEAVDWGKQNIADLTQTATDLRIRFVDQGKQYPAPVTTLREATFVGAGYPDYPWMFATDGEYTAFASVAVGQFEAIKEHLLGLRDISDALNARSGKVAHEIVTDGSVWFGANTDPGNTDESVKFPSAVALVWRWTGDDRFRDSLYDFSVRNLRYVTNTLDEDDDGWPEGLGNVERAGMGEEKLDNTVYYVRGLYDLADMAAAKRDRSTERWARGLADRVAARFDSTWWDAPSGQYADSLDERNDRIQQKHWIGVTPMEAELTIDGAASPASHRSNTAAPRSRSARRRATAASRPTTAACSTRAAAAARPAPVSGRSSRSTPPSRPSASATTGVTRAATRGPTPPRCSSPTRCRARCRRSCRRRTSATARTTTATSTAAGPAARCSSRPGATTAPRGRSCTSSSVCGRRWAPGRSRSCRSCRPGRRAPRGARSGSARARWTCARSAPAGATSRPSAPTTCASTTCGSAPRCRAGRRSARSRSTGAA